jgi:hypothetical protein
VQVTDESFGRVATILAEQNGFQGGFKMGIISGESLLPLAAESFVFLLSV